ncbi:alkaline phosphatase [Candidatus Thorarchaeota archaeon]|nr:MAG: alkaline phosphatase [Candidatus Thorarchaeota archaeon]
MFSRVSSWSTTSLLLIAVFCIGLVATTPYHVLAVQIEPATEEDPLSVILMIGDGMGYEHVKLARWVEVGRNGMLRMERYDFAASVLTHSLNEQITDSAAAATALATGNKTNNSMLSVSPSGERLETILEIAEEREKATGVVSTCFVQHATPAGFYAHVENRGHYYEIARQAVEEASVDVIMGGGTRYFNSSQLITMEGAGYDIVTNRSQLLSTTSTRILGLFADSHMDFERDRDYEETPSLAEMTDKSIDVLSQDSDGFFLMVEGGRIDHAGHDNDKVDDALDTIAFDNAVGVAIDYIRSHPNTILLVTADHECGGLTVMNGTLNDTLPNSSMDEDGNRSLRIERVNNITVSWSSDYHTAAPVPLYCFGDVFASLPANHTIDNTDMFHLMDDYYAGEQLSIINVTTSTTTTTTTTTETTTAIDTTPPAISPIVLAALVLIPVLVIAVIFLVRRYR